MAGTKPIPEFVVPATNVSLELDSINSLKQTIVY